MNEIFKSIDSNTDGLIDKWGVKDFVKFICSEMNLTEPENSVLDEVYDDLDENGDGTVDM